jgi:hypothetical protein
MKKKKDLAEEAIQLTISCQKDSKFKFMVIIKKSVQGTAHIFSYMTDLD